MGETSRGRVLLVDDGPVVADVLGRYLTFEGYEVASAKDGGEALALFRSWQPDLLVLDLMLPVIDGMEVCRILRKESQVPIIMLTARGEETDRIVGLELGADDYVVKPFSPRELVARIKAVLRRAVTSQTTVGPQQSLHFGDLTIDASTRGVQTQVGPATLTAKEFDLLYFLASHPGQVFTREQLMDAVWDYDYAGDASTVTVHVRRIREKIEADSVRPRYLKTVWGVGYKFEATP